MVNLRRAVFLGLFTLLICLNGSYSAFSQRYLTDLDTTLFIRDSLRPLLKNFENLRISGYIQPQFQVAQTPGTVAYEGGPFQEFSKSRFMLRRARIRIDYLVPNDKNEWATALFAFQVDATERGVYVRDMFLRVYENKFNYFNLTAGLFARPFGYEINLSSSVREAPERGRMSQILMPSERDIGAMISFEPQVKSSALSFFKLDAGLFNGQGLSGPTDFDSQKDFISRLTIKPVEIGEWEFGAGLSMLYGGWRQHTKYLYSIQDEQSLIRKFDVDSSITNIGKTATRSYYGADMQIKLKHGWGATELRAEYWKGNQPGTATTTSNPGTLPEEPTYIRNFNGAFISFLQNIVNEKHQLIVKYDWYDPNSKVLEKDIGAAGSNLTSADIRFNTLGVGYVHYFSDHLRMVLYKSLIRNKPTQLQDYTEDLPDNVFTWRMHFMF